MPARGWAHERLSTAVRPAAPCNEGGSGLVNLGSQWVACPLHSVSTAAIAEVGATEWGGGGGGGGSPSTVALGGEVAVMRRSHSHNAIAP